MRTVIRQVGDILLLIHLKILKNPEVLPHFVKLQCSLQEFYVSRTQMNSSEKVNQGQQSEGCKKRTGCFLKRFGGGEGGGVSVTFSLQSSALLVCAFLCRRCLVQGSSQLLQPPSLVQILVQVLGHRAQAVQEAEETTCDQAGGFALT